VLVDLAKGEHKTPEFLRKNPLGQIPVMEDGDLTLFDSNAMLVYLALRYDKSGTWYPREAVAAARVQQWLSIAAGELCYGPAVARAVKLFGLPRDHARAREIALQLFPVIDEHLGVRRFLTGDSPTLADLAIYSYTVLAPEGGVPLEPYERMSAWLRRVEALDGFVPVTQTIAGLRT
jgi:glutathione S-transferase